MHLEPTRQLSKTTLKFWPSPQDYNEAVQNPALSFSDPELKRCLPELDALGLPRPVSGAFASVYNLCDQSMGRRFAVRCFLQHVEDQQHRYEMISRYIMSDDLPYTVSFEFQEKGLLVDGVWYPILKMEWVDGLTLEQFIETNLGNAAALERLRDEFARMHQDLMAAGIAHGDLQHGNIMVTPAGDLRLVDYDGVFVPEMTGLAANELGHRNYQHPQRDAHHFGPELDNFSAWVIYVSLTALCRDPFLYQKLSAGNDCLLFRKEDFENPENSRAFSTLRTHSDRDIRDSVGSLEALLALGPMTSQRLGTQLPIQRTKAKPRWFERFFKNRTTGKVASERRNKSGPSGSAHGADDIDVDLWWHNFLNRKSETIQSTKFGLAPRKLTRARTGLYPTDVVSVAFLFLALIIGPVSVLSPFLNNFYLWTAFISLGVLVAISMFYLLWNSISSTLHQYFVIRNGTCAPAVVRNRTARGEFRTVTVEYPLRRGNKIESFTALVQVSKEQWNRLSAGDLIHVFYLNRCPEKCVIYEGACYTVASLVVKA